MIQDKEKIEDSQSNETPLISHLIELRKRLVYSFVAFILASLLCYSFAQEIYAFLVKPLSEILKGEDRRLIYTGLTEAFFTYIKLAVFAGGFLSLPVIISQIWLFVAPALYKKEKRAFLPFLIATPVLFLVGASFVYYFVVPVAWKFFVGFETIGLNNNSLPIKLEARVGEYLSLIMTLIFAFGLCFQMPVLLTLLAKVGIINAKSLVNKRRYAVVIIFIMAAVLTPPDIISQLMLAIPLILLYEISLLLVKIAEKKAA